MVVEGVVVVVGVEVEEEREEAKEEVVEEDKEEGEADRGEEAEKETLGVRVREATLPTPRSQMVEEGPTTRRLLLAPPHCTPTLDSQLYQTSDISLSTSHSPAAIQKTLPHSLSPPPETLFDPSLQVKKTRGVPFSTTVKTFQGLLDVEIGSGDYYMSAP